MTLYRVLVLVRDEREGGVIELLPSRHNTIVQGVSIILLVHALTLIHKGAIL